MTYQDIITLAKAGFTAQQIGQLAQAGAGTGAGQSASAGDGNGQMPAPAMAQAPAPAMAQAPAPAMAQAPAPAMENVAGQLSFQGWPDSQGFQAIISEAVKAGVQQANVMNSQMPEQQTTEDILASIINPPGIE